MSRRDSPIAGAGYFLRGFSLICRSGVKRFVIAPIVLNAILYGWLVWLGTRYAGAWIDRLTPSGLGWLRWLIWPVFVGVALLLVYFTFAVAANIVGAPFNGFLAGAVERRLTGRASPSRGATAVLAEAAIAVGRELRRCAYYSMWAVPCLAVFFIPVVNVAAPFIWATLGAWVLALEYTAYPLDNHRLSFREQRRRLRGKRWTALGLGGAAMLAGMVPIVNLLVMPVAVAGGTAMALEMLCPDDRDGLADR